MKSSKKQIRQVLVVDDDEITRCKLTAILEMEKLMVSSADNGRSAVEFLKRYACDLLITDYRMPFIDGLQLISWCKEQNLRFPVIFLSTDASEIKHSSIALPQCCATLMVKPFRDNVLSWVVQQFIREQHHRLCVHNYRRAVDSCITLESLV